MLDQLQNYEEIVSVDEPDIGLRAWIAVHNTKLGPALGGMRLWQYQDEEEAKRDVMRLAKGMTYKNALAGLAHGGGKTVIMGDPKRKKNEWFLKLGEIIEQLQGRYITAEDVNTTTEDMDLILTKTRFVTGVSPRFGGSGNPSPTTAYGVYVGMKAGAQKLWGSDSLRNKWVAVQGAGAVASHLCEYLQREGAKIVVSDVFFDKAERLSRMYGTRIVSPEDIYHSGCDIFAPCALGGSLNFETIPQLQSEMVAGAANNQLLNDECGQLLQKRNIVYLPDYVLNAGGVVHVADEKQVGGYRAERVNKAVEKIARHIEQIIDISQKKGIPTNQAADELAEEIIQNKK